MKNFLNLLIEKWLRGVTIGLLAVFCAVACAQDQEADEGDDAAQIEIKDKDAAKRAKKAERKSRKEKKSGSSVTLPPPPQTPAEFEFLEGVIFSRKANLGLNGVLCFASERRPLATLWKEGAAAAPLKLTARELQIIFGRTVDGSQVSVLNENGQMLSRGSGGAVSLRLSRKPIYLLVEASASRSQAAARPVEEEIPAFHENLAEVRVYPDPKRAKGTRAIIFANLTQHVTIQILTNEKIIFEIINPGTPAWKWEGSNQNRQPLPDGKYQYRILAKGGSASGAVELKSY